MSTRHIGFSEHPEIFLALHHQQAKKGGGGGSQRCVLKGDASGQEEPAPELAVSEWFSTTTTDNNGDGDDNSFTLYRKKAKQPTFEKKKKECPPARRDEQNQSSSIGFDLRSSLLVEGAQMTEEEHKKLFYSAQEIQVFQDDAVHDAMLLFSGYESYEQEPGLVKWWKYAVTHRPKSIAACLLDTYSACQNKQKQEGKEKSDTHKINEFCLEKQEFDYLLQVYVMHQQDNHPGPLVVVDGLEHFCLEKVRYAGGGRLPHQLQMLRPSEVSNYCQTRSRADRLFARQIGQAQAAAAAALL